MAGLGPLEGIRLFHETLEKTLKNLKVIRSEKKRENEICIPKPVKRAIELKRLKDKEVRKGTAPMQELLDARKSVTRAISTGKRKSYLKFITKGTDYLKNNDSRNSWRWIKLHSGLARKRVSVDLIYKPGTREPEPDPKERVKLWADHFRRLSMIGPAGAEQDEISTANSDVAVITDAPISWPEIASVLKAMRKGKAAGNDMIPGEIYKLVETEAEPISQLAKSMHLILNNIYNSEHFPIEWRDCAVVPVFKKGDQLDPNNYRGIALINTLLKVLTKVVASRLQTVCSAYNLLNREQVGFIKGERACPRWRVCLRAANEGRSGIRTRFSAS